MTRPRARALDWVAGDLPTGAHNALTDVAGVRVGHATLVSGEGPLQPGLGPIRTGVTVILPHEGNPFQKKVRAAALTLNGFGKAFGFEQVRELGVLESPVALTNTLNVGLVADALVQYSIQHNPDIGIRTSSVNVVVGETNDGYLNDLQGRHVRAEHVFAALESASAGPVAEGALGAGTGTVCLGWKGGLGTASRVLPAKFGGFTLGALVQSNFGSAAELTVRGVPVGKLLKRLPPATPPGSIMIILATDAPLDSRQLGRLCARAAMGLARVGSTLQHGSGDFVIAFSTAHPLAHEPAAPTEAQTVLVDEALGISTLGLAVIECVEEAVLNSLCRAETMTGRDGHVAHALPLEEVSALIRRHRPEVGQ